MLRLHINMAHPQPRHISRAVSILRSGGIAVFPTDTTYALGCDLYARRSIDRIYQLKGMDKKKPLSFLCSDLAEVARYAIVEDDNYRVLRKKTPGQYTFILPASREVPKIVQSKKRAVGVRIPDSPVCLAIIRELGHPLISTTVARSNDDGVDYSNDPDEIIKMFGRSIELMIDGEALYEEPSSVIDLSGDDPEIIREGSGDLAWLKD
jgi:tRNA threonylcarbamoyl adenosine modification protein (Sua5/YciO/YrdC/YwlC family)